MTAEMTTLYVLKCDDPDGCSVEVYMGDGSGVFNSPAEARQEAHEQGWATSGGGWDYCPYHAHQQGVENSPAAKNQTRQMREIANLHHAALDAAGNEASTANGR